MARSAHSTAFSQWIGELDAVIRDGAARGEGQAYPCVLADRIETGAECIVSRAGNGAVVGLSLREYGLPALPAFPGELTDLEHLDLSGNQLASLPPNIGALTHLSRLLLDDNQLGALPDSLGALANLRWLAVDGNALTALPTTIGNLTNLERLDARRNRFATVPDGVLFLYNLRDLVM